MSDIEELRKGPEHWNQYAKKQRGLGLAWFADLRFADLQDADLRDADLRFADLQDADLQDAKFKDAPAAPKDIYKLIAEAIRKPNALEMGCWHSECGTAHCLAGWAEVLTPGGKEFAEKTSTQLVGLLVAPDLAPYFYGTNEEALKATEKYLDS